MTIATVGLLVIGPFHVVQFLSDRIPFLKGVAAKASSYYSSIPFIPSKRQVFIVAFYVAITIVLLLSSGFPRKGARLGRTGNLCFAYCLLLIAGLRTPVLAERLIGCGSCIYAAFLLWTMSAHGEGHGSSARMRMMVFIQLAFLLVSSALLYNAALRPIGHYSFALMGGDWGRLFTSSLIDFLGYRVLW
jgi:hypothetical protein